MIRPTAFVGELIPYAFDWDRRTVVVRVGVPVSEVDAVLKALGPPPRPGDQDDPEHMRAVAVLTCRIARHPQTEADALAETCVATLTDLFTTGALGDRVRWALHEQMAGLFNAAELAWQLPPARAEPRVEDRRADITRPPAGGL